MQYFTPYSHGSPLYQTPPDVPEEMELDFEPSDVLILKRAEARKLERQIREIKKQMEEK